VSLLSASLKDCLEEFSIRITREEFMARRDSFCEESTLIRTNRGHVDVFEIATAPWEKNPTADSASEVEYQDTWGEEKEMKPMNSDQHWKLYQGSKDSEDYNDSQKPYVNRNDFKHPYSVGLLIQNNALTLSKTEQTPRGKEAQLSGDLSPRVASVDTPTIHQKLAPLRTRTIVNPTQAPHEGSKRRREIKPRHF